MNCMVQVRRFALIALLLLLVVGTGAMIFSEPHNPVPAPLAGRAGSYTSFGDSISTCSHPSSQLTCYVDMLAAEFNLPVTKRAVAGSQAADQADAIYSTVVSSSGRPLYTYMVGTNDNWIYGTNPIRQGVFQSADLAELAWLAIPESHKIRGQSGEIAYRGHWANSEYYGGSLGKVSNSYDSKAKVSVYGSTVYVGITIQDLNQGAFTLTVDGGSLISYSASAGAGANIATHLGRTYAPRLIRISHLVEGRHTIVLSVTSDSSETNRVWLDWVAGVSGVRQQWPLVIAGGVLPNSGFPELATTAYSNIVVRNVAMLRRDGLNVSFAETPDINIKTDLFRADGVHPIDSGFAKLFRAFDVSFRNSVPGY
ncbi:MAG: hypothetical protein JOZ22_23135 [Acidobacteriia bacterium]|nr:hypothetical protein [Terriglobia bacterium]